MTAFQICVKPLKNRIGHQNHEFCDHFWVEKSVFKGNFGILDITELHTEELFLSNLFIFHISISYFLFVSFLWFRRQKIINSEKIEELRKLVLSWAHGILDG